MPEIIAKARQEALIYKQADIDVLMIENMHDVPFDRNVGPEIAAAMAVVGYEVKQTTGLRCGVQILAAANKEALGAAQAAGLDFVRAEGFVFGHVADEGYIDGSAADLLRYRRQIGAEAGAIVRRTTVDADFADRTHLADTNSLAVQVNVLNL